LAGGFSLFQWVCDQTGKLKIGNEPVTVGFFKNVDSKEDIIFL
jgi:hypothetical protein